VRLGDTEVCQQLDRDFGFHGRAAVGMERELSGRHLVLGRSILEQHLEQSGVFGIGDTPADDAAAEDVDDDIEIEIGPLCRPHQLCDVP